MLADPRCRVRARNADDSDSRGDEFKVYDLVIKENASCCEHVRVSVAAWMFRRDAANDG